MKYKTRDFEIIDKSIGANGPSMNLGVFLLVFGFVTTLGGFANLNYSIIITGLTLLLLTALSILSIDCIAIDKCQNRLYLYRDYYFKIIDKEFIIDEYEAICIVYQIDRPRRSRYNWYTTQQKTYSVILLSKKGEKIILKEFGEINQAKYLQLNIVKYSQLKLIKEPIRET